MIDYEKLKLAHELAQYYGIITSCFIDITVRRFSSESVKPYFIFKTETNDERVFIDIDLLIVFLQELIKLKNIPEFKIGDLIWFVGSEKEIRWMKVEGIKTYDECTVYKQYSTGWVITSKIPLFSTKKELIEAQIETWVTLLSEEENKTYYKGFNSTNKVKNE